VDDGLWIMDDGALLREPDERAESSEQRAEVLLRELASLPGKRVACCLFCSELSVRFQVILLSLIAKSITYKKYFTVVKYSHS
jgi:hypothetical protein